MKLDADNKARLAFGVMLVLVAAGAVTWYAIVEAGYTTYQIVTRDPVSGLIPDAPIEFHGVDVGRVKRIELTGPDSVRVLLAIKDDAPVSTATVATITSRGLATRGFTGYVYVALEDVGTERGPIRSKPGEPYPTLPTAASRSVNLDMAIDQVNRNVQQITDALEATLDPKTTAALKKSLTHIDEMSASMTGVAKKLERDPSVVVRGAARRPPGPGESR